MKVKLEHIERSWMLSLQQLCKFKLLVTVTLGFEVMNAHRTKTVRRLGGDKQSKVTQTNPIFTYQLWGRQLP